MVHASFEVANAFPSGVSTATICALTSDALCAFAASLPPALQSCKQTSCTVSPAPGPDGSRRLASVESVVASVSLQLIYGSDSSAPSLVAGDLLNAIEADPEGFNSAYAAAALKADVVVGAPSRVALHVDVHSEGTAKDLLMGSLVLKACVAAMAIALATCLESSVCYWGYCRCCCCKLEEKDPDHERMSSAAQRRSERDRRSEERKGQKSDFQKIAHKNLEMV